MEISHIRTEIDGHQAYQIVAIEPVAEEMMGTLKVYQLETDFPHLCDIYVHPAYRRQGVTSELVNKALELLKADGYADVRLIAKDDNEAAVKCYEKLGFFRYKDAPDMPGFGFHVYQFR